MSTVAEIESALKELPTTEAQEVARWLQEHLQQQIGSLTSGPITTPPMIPDYAARRRTILGDKVLPNMVLADREQGRW